MTFFSGRVADLLRLAEDEARMLGRASVEPEHLLLALCRHGRGQELLAQRSLRPQDLYEAVVRIDGDGDELLLGRLPRSRRSQRVLEHAVTVAAERGVSSPDDVEVLLALTFDDRASTVLDEVGLGDLSGLIAQEHPSGRAPLDGAAISRSLLEAVLDERPRSQHGVRVPAFERFSSQARRAIAAAAETAARLEHREVQLFHLLLGCLQVSDSLAAHALGDLWADGELGVVGEAIELACRVGPPPSHQATGIFTQAARRVVAEDALALAYRHGHRQITTGHLLLAVLGSGDQTTELMTRPHTQRLARTLVGWLPGSEQFPLGDTRDPAADGERGEAVAQMVKGQRGEAGGIASEPEASAQPESSIGSPAAAGGARTAAGAAPRCRGRPRHGAGGGNPVPQRLGLTLHCSSNLCDGLENRRKVV